MEIIKGSVMPGKPGDKCKEFLDNTKPGDMIIMFYADGLYFVNRLRSYTFRKMVSAKVRTKKVNGNLHVWRVS